jgi:hypothetical protein
MKKTASAVIVVLLLASILEFGFITHPVSASGDAEALRMITLEDVSILGNGTVQVSILMNASSGSLADMYRKMLAAPATVGIDEEVPIPENTTEKIEAGGNATDASIPVKEGFCESIIKEQLLSLGLRTEIIESKMVPRGNGNECRVMMSALGSFEIFNVANTDSNEVWEVGLGPFNSTGITGLVLTRLIFTQMMLGSLPGEQVYQNFWQVRFRLPADAVLLNNDSLSGLNWTINFNEGTYLKASVSLTEGSTILIDENIAVTEDNITATPEYLSNVLSNYKAFKIKYSLPSSEKSQNESEERDQLNTNWSCDPDTGWMEFPDIPLPFRYTGSRGNLDMRLTISPKFRIIEDVGWQFFLDWNFPFVHPDKFWAQTNFSTSIGIRFEANANLILYQNAWNLYYWNIRYPIYYGVPGWINLVFRIDAKLEIKGNMSFIAEGVINGELEAGLQWNRTNGWNRISPPPKLSANVTGFTWEFAVGVSVTPSISFRIEFQFYDVAGPFLEFVPYVTIAETLVLPNETILWDISIDFDIYVGVTFAGWLPFSDWNWKLVHLNLYHLSGSWNLGPPSAKVKQIHDLMIVGVTAYPSLIIAHTASIVDVNVTARNSGNSNETSDVSLFQNDSLIGTYSHVNFTLGEDNLSHFVWNTNTLAPSSYILKAKVNAVEEETNITDNEMNITVQIVARNDIALLDIRIEPNETYVGRTVDITVTVRNVGELTEDVNVTVNCNLTAIYTQSVKGLASSEETVLVFLLDTTSLIPGQTYVIWTNATTLHYDIDVTNNIFINDTNVVKIKIIGDINGDDTVDIEDIYTAAVAFGAYQGHEKWDSNTDTNSDGIIDIVDIYIIAINFGKTCTQ